MHRNFKSVYWAWHSEPWPCTKPNFNPFESFMIIRKLLKDYNVNVVYAMQWKLFLISAFSWITMLYTKFECKWISSRENEIFEVCSIGKLSNEPVVPNCLRDNPYNETINYRYGILFRNIYFVHIFESWEQAISRAHN